MNLRDLFGRVVLRVSDLVLVQKAQVLTVLGLPCERFLLRLVLFVGLQHDELEPEDGTSLEQALDSDRSEGVLELEHDQAVAKGALTDHELRIPRCRRHGDRNPEVLVGGALLRPTRCRLLSLAVP